MTPRLSRATLAALADGRGHAVPGPAVDPASTTVGLVHLGLGAFHRAHQAVYTEDAAAAAGDTGWGILGVTQRSARVAEHLAPQDGLYGVLTKGATHTSLRLIGSLRDVAFPGERTPHVLRTIAAPSTHVVTLTVTEKGYRRRPDGLPDLTDPDLGSDVAALAAEIGGAPPEQPARSPIGLLVRGLALRHRQDAGPLTVVCCDNLAENGRVVGALVHELLAAVPHAQSLAQWVRASVAFPSTMVDRIVPATTDAHRTEATALLGLRDEGLVVGEPFTQWVVEDTFAGPRPAWERAGATLTADVAPFERAKLRVLNASHSTLAYLGALRGYATIAEAVADPELEAIVRALVDEDVLPTLEAPEGLDLVRYRDDVLDRFANPNTGHTTVQVAMDGSAKLPQRLLGTVRDRLAAGAVPTAAAATLAAWMSYVHATTHGGLEVAGRKVSLDDPLADALASAADGPVDGLVDRLLAVREVFGADLAASSELRSAVRAHVRTLALV
ncbi:mannitol dehydrogenase family protein [Cellulomonas fimi]|uniref:Mannitol-1-phosphate 5-dehydrogenase n=1 Tax=Cellulomonas fimi (strain ATCC 484 / DSM 20113 / JCM 1341 / CCUG 24087 / LMG 16345 / NBRC 15513 / NCIMB 8980 / NCTC 7547 / NRS-133) TaxID=590998 RepID=F4H139_CELFA|nr:mannitol dehydrogenase family protein [Cellulomonas fimi]AEE47408.1 Mannitol dehydrogenase domain protein [Cellulomonas fimi ATCC 484]NNH05764.1 mannitol dehydrogenase family protein [Cellulomonas fimi]VEH36131.1 Mannitol 2-dehydrogenase [Cellulomonas fimi]